MKFDGIENEWPLFYIFMIIDGVFKNLPEQVAEYQELLKQHVEIDKNGGFKFCLDKLFSKNKKLSYRNYVFFSRSNNTDVLLRRRR